MILKYVLMPRAHLHTFSDSSLHIFLPLHQNSKNSWYSIHIPLQLPSNSVFIPHLKEALSPHVSTEITLAYSTITSLSHVRIRNVEMIVQMETNKYFPKREVFCFPRIEINHLGTDKDCVAADQLRKSQGCKIPSIKSGSDNWKIVLYMMGFQMKYKFSPIHLILTLHWKGFLQKCFVHVSNNFLWPFQ